MAAIGTGWADGAWIAAGWVTEAWDDTENVAVPDATKGGGARSLREMRRLERQQLLEMLRQDDEMVLPILLQLLRRR